MRFLFDSSSNATNFQYDVEDRYNGIVHLVGQAIEVLDDSVTDTLGVEQLAEHYGGRLDEDSA